MHHFGLGGNPNTKRILHRTHTEGPTKCRPSQTSTPSAAGGKVGGPSLTPPTPASHQEGGSEWVDSWWFPATVTAVQNAPSPGLVTGCWRYNPAQANPPPPPPLLPGTYIGWLTTLPMHGHARPCYKPQKYSRTRYWIITDNGLQASKCRIYRYLQTTSCREPCDWIF